MLSDAEILKAYWKPYYPQMSSDYSDTKFIEGYRAIAAAQDAATRQEERERIAEWLKEQAKHELDSIAIIYDRITAKLRQQASIERGLEDARAGR